MNKNDLQDFSTHFHQFKTEESHTILDINAINRLSELRDDWNNVESTSTEYRLNTSANTDDRAFLRSEERGQYTSGFMAEAGIGARVPEEPTGDSVMRWGYFEHDENNNPLNGFYFGVDSNGIFVARAFDGDVEKVYQENWNRDKLDDKYPQNGSDKTIDLSDGLVYHINFTYYGYGPIQMQVLLDDDDSDEFGTSDLVTAHVFHVKESTSIGNTNLPVGATIESNSTNTDALDLFVGGRQFSVIGSETSNSRVSGHYRDELAGVDDTQWYPAISFKLKDGTDNIGSGYDFSHILGELYKFSIDADANAYRWQIRRDTQLDNPTWETPSTHSDKPDETAFKVDTNSTDITDADGNLTGVLVDASTVEEGQKNVASLEDEDISGQITNGQIVTLSFQAVPASSGTISEIFFKFNEMW